MEVLSYNLLNL